MSAEELDARLSEQAPAVENVELMIDVVRAIRNVRAEFKIEPRKTLDATIDVANDGTALAAHSDAIKQLARVGTLAFGAPGSASDSVKLVVGPATVTLAVGGAVDLNAEHDRLTAEAGETETYLKGLSGRLSNEQFTSRAPEDVVERERERLEEGQARLERIRELLNDIG